MSWRIPPVTPWIGGARDRRSLFRLDGTFPPGAAARPRAAPEAPWSRRGGSPLDHVANFAETLQTIELDGNSMPAFGGTLTAEQIRAVGAHVVERLAGTASRGVEETR